MPRRSVTIINKLGMHARAAAKFVKIASGFDCDISVALGNKEVSGKSIMGIMMLAASKGSTLQIITSGRDEEEALDTLEKLVMDRFGENE